MPDHVGVVFSHKGNERCGVASQGIREIRFGAPFERREVHRTDALGIALPLFSNDDHSRRLQTAVCGAGARFAHDRHRRQTGVPGLKSAVTRFLCAR
jgi:hypothetical protein